MSSEVDVDEAIEGIIADRLRVDRSAFDDETPFTGETIDADSLDIVEAAEAVDMNLGVHVPDAELEAIETVGDLKSFVRSELG